MLFLYPKNTTDFTNNGDPIHHSYDEHVIRDDGFYLTFNLLLDKEEGYKKVKKEMIIGANTPDGPNQFRVYDVKKKNTHVEVTAVQLMYDFDNKEVNPFSVKNATGNQVITKFRSSFKSALGQFTMDSSVNEVHDFTTNEVEDDTPSHNALEVLNRITSRWDSELMLNGFDIRMIKRLGQKTDALLYEKKNISDFEDFSSVSGMATRIHATSKFTPEGKENEVTLSVTVDSPLINEYAQIYEKSFVTNECRTETELIAWVKLKYSTENIDKPSRSITVATNIIDGTEINYGDDLVLKYLVHDVDEVIRCVGYDYDPIRKTYYSVTLGDWKDSFLNTVTSNIVDSTNKQFNQLKNNITYVSMSANGKNRNAYGPEPVPNPINGDQWYYYELDRPNDVELRVYQDGFWVKFDFFATKKEIDAVLTEAEEAKQEAIESYNNAVADAATYTNTKAREFDNKLVAVNQEVANVTQAANAAISKADQAIQDVGFMQIDVTTAKTNAASALENANTAKANASTALTNANSALTKVGALEVTTGSLQTSYNDLTKTVGLKADKTTVDGINSKVTQHGLDISANATAVGLKADKSVVDSIKGTVDKHTLDIKAAADGLTLKADSSLVNTIKGTVDTHTTQISANSQAITARLTSAQIETLLTGKKYVNETTLNATANGLSASITQVSSDLNNLEIGGRNYLRNSNFSSGFEFWKENGVDGSITGNVYYASKVGGSERFYYDTLNLLDISETVTISLDVRLSKGSSAHLKIGQSSNQGENILVTSEWRRFSRTFNPNSEFTLSIFLKDYDVIYAFRNLKLERGNKATDWTPAPEDMATLEQFTTIDATVKGLQTTVGNKAEQSQVTQLAGQISSKVESAVYNSKMTQLDSAINLRVTKGDVTAQINVEAGVTLISNKKLLLDANTYIMGTTFANEIRAISLDAVYVNASTVRTKLLTADVITSTMLKSDTALIDKIFVTDANVNRLTAKTAFINSVKAVDIAADRITSGTFNGAKMNVINIDASAISANTLASLTSNTGTLNVTGYVNILNSDTGIYGKFNYGGVQGESYNPRWFDGNWRLGTNLLRFQADAYNLTSTNGKGTRIAYYETQYGSDFIALRKYNSSTNMTLQSRVDIQSDMIQIADNWNDVNAGVILRSNGTISASGITARANLTVGTNLDVTGSSVLRSTLDVAGGTILRSSLDVQGNLISRTTARFEGVITATSGMSLSGNLTVGSQVDITGASIIRSTLDVQGSLTTRSTARFEGATKITSTLSVDGQVQATNIYNNTQSQSANVWVSSYGYLFRATSASKYKLNIEPLENELDYAKKVLQLQPKKWHDKHAVEMYASYLTAKEKGVIPTVSQDELLKITKSVGLIAEDLEQVGLTDFVTKSEKTGEIEGIEYSMLHVLYIPLIKDLYRQIEQQNKTIMELERKIV